MDNDKLKQWAADLNKEPLPDNIKKNDDGSFYIPISITQSLLDEIFMGQWDFEMTSSSYGRKWARGNGYMDCINPITGLKTRRGGDAAILLTGNVRTDSPRLEAMVLLSCARKFGKFLGRDLNRSIDDKPLPVVKVEKLSEDKELERMKSLFNDCTSVEELIQYKIMATPKYLTPYNAALKSLKGKKIMIDFSNALIRSSATGLIMSEPKDAAAKKNGELSKSAKTYLINTYIKEKYGREKEITTKQMSKGIENEEDGITILSRFKKKFLKKNETRVENKYQTGHPDIFEGESIFQADYIIDTKLSWDIWSFLPNILDPLDKTYWWQLQSYFSLTGAKKGEIAYVLTDTPDSFIQSEKFRLLKSMNVISDESPEYIEAAAKMEINMIYPDLPIEEKVLIFPVERDDEAIEKINLKVVKCREFLQWFSDKHKNFNNS